MLEFLAGFQDVALLFSRVFLGVMFMVHGKPKMIGPKPGVDGFASYLEDMGFPMPKLLALLAAATEFWGGLMLIAGVLIRPVALLMAILIIVATYVNVEKNEQEFKGGWEFDLIILAVCLVLMTFGGGEYSLLAWFGI